MKLKLRIKTFIFILLSSLSSTAEWVGYRTFDQVTDPFDIYFIEQVSLRSTYKLISYEFPIKDLTKVEFVNTNEIPEVSDVELLQNDSFHLQVETCRKQNIRKCPIGTTRSESTIFIEDKKNLHLCRHSIHPWMVAVKYLNPELELKNIMPVMKILDKDGNLIYMSSSKEVNLSSMFINDDPVLNVLLNDESSNEMRIYFRATEYINIVLNKEIVDNGVNIRAIAPQLTRNRYEFFKNMKLYASGFPLKTDKFGGADQGDTDGKSMVFSTGRIINFREEAVTAMITSSPGMSGGPVFSETLEFVGLACNGYPSGATNIVTSDKEAHRRAWQRSRVQ